MSRSLVIPDECALTDDEIIRALEVLHERKVQGAAGFTVDAGVDDYYTLKVPMSAAISREDIVICLDRLNQAVAFGYADVLFTVQDGRFVKRWVTFKDRADGRSPAKPMLTSGGQRAPEF